MTEQLGRISRFLCLYKRHCFKPGEDNVFSRIDPNQSIAPEANPSSTPSIKPTGVPTVASTEKSSSAIVVETSPPTTMPIASTLEPSGTPTIVSETAESASLAPTTAVPTNLESVPTPDTSDKNCVSDESGSFGSTSSEGTVAVVDYLYQVDTTPVIDALELNSRLPSIEKGISDALIPQLFGDDELCQASAAAVSVRSGGRKISQHPHWRKVQEDKLLGLSVDPPDEVREGDECPLELNDIAENCFFVEGGMMLYGSGDLTSKVEQSEGLIKEAMDSGRFNNLDEDIISVRFVQREKSSELEPSQLTGEVDKFDVKMNWAGVLGGVGALVLVSLMVIALDFPFLKRREETQSNSPNGAFPEDNPNSWSNVPSPPRGRGDSEEYHDTYPETR